MSGFKLRVKDGPYAGEYSIDPDDFTGTEINRFRHAVGISVTEATSGNAIDLDSICGFIWLQKTRSSANKGLPFGAVGDNITRGQVEPMAPDEKVEPDPADPSSSAAE